MLHTLSSIAAVNLYWLTWPMIGYAVLLFVSKFQKFPIVIRRSARVLVKQHIFITFLASLVLICTISAPVFLLFYLFGSPVGLAVAYYLVMLCISVIYLLNLLVRSLFTSIKWDPLRIAGQNNIIKYSIIVLCVALVSDFLLSGILKSYVIPGVDAYYHVTRILFMLSIDHISMGSGYFASVMDSSYHTSFIYIPYVIYSSLSHTPPLMAWGDSFGFFRLIQWLSVYTLGYYVFQIWTSEKMAVLYASLTTIMAISMLSYINFTAPYPNRVVMVWIVAYAIMLMDYARKPNKAALVGLISSGLLISITHPTYALMTAIFTVYWYAIYTLVHWKEMRAHVRRTYQALMPVVTLFVGPIITKLIPSHITSAQLNLDSPKTVDFLSMSIDEPARILPGSLYQWALLLLSLIGLYYLLHRWWKRDGSWGRVSVVVALTTFSTFILLIPPVFTILRLALPIWVIERFTAMNVLSYILPTLGILGLVMFFIQKSKMSKEVSMKVGIVAFVGVVIIVSTLIAPITYKSLIASRSLNWKTYEYMNSLGDGLSSTIPIGSLVLADDRVGYQLPAVLPVSVVAIPAGHSTISADTSNRIACRAHLFKYLDYADLQATHVDYIVVSRFDKNIEAINTAIDTNKYLHKTDVYSDLTVYAVDKLGNGPGDGNVYSACAKYQSVEGDN